MKLTYHRLAILDVRKILDHYEAVSGTALADRFFKELMASIKAVASNPKHFPPVDELRRRKNLPTFPYHLIYEENLVGIRILIVKHHRRSPDLGSRRK